MRHVPFLVAMTFSTFTPLSAQWSIQAFGSGGFSGRSVRSAAQIPAFTEGALVADSVDLATDDAFDWRPTVSGGLAFQLPAGGVRVGPDDIPDLSTDRTRDFGRIYIGFKGAQLGLLSGGG